ncbi:MAG: histidine phosphotransferase family protein [Paracoccaceae bacterium]|nr:histidine phosphotransferase family protein [Paracoccaceae bacterium]
MAALPIPEDEATRADEAGALSALIGSRICHDLANPIGAIANGVELLQMAGAGPGSPELALVADSVAHASARLRFFRVAFGAAGPGQMLGRSETALILADSYGGGRLAVSWGVTTDQPRAEVKVAFLLLQCIESNLPRGGEAHVSLAGGRWRLEARAERMKEEPGLWALLDGRPLPETLKPAEVQFALAPRAAAAVGRRIAAEVRPGTVALTF